MDNRVTDTVEEKLDTLAELQAQRDAIALEKQALRDGVLTEEIRTQLADIDLEFAPRENETADRIDELIREVKTAVLAHGASVKGARLQAVWSKPRINWDTPGLLGFAQAHPEVATFMRVGKASVSLRKC